MFVVYSKLYYFRLYRLHDRFFTFWFKYIFPNRGRIETGNSEYVIKLIKESFGHHISSVYEEICIDLCKTLMYDGAMRWTTIGRWWTKNGEIDIVALDEDTKTAYFAECKWSNKKVGVDIYRDLMRKSLLVDWFNDSRQNRFLLFSKSGFTGEMIELARKDNVVLIHKDKTVNI